MKTKNSTPLIIMAVLGWVIVILILTLNAIEDRKYPIHVHDTETVSTSATK